MCLKVYKNCLIRTGVVSLELQCPTAYLKVSQEPQGKSRMSWIFFSCFFIGGMRNSGLTSCRECKHYISSLEDGVIQSFWGDNLYLPWGDNLDLPWGKLLGTGARGSQPPSKYDNLYTLFIVVNHVIRLLKRPSWFLIYVIIKTSTFNLKNWCFTSSFTFLSFLAHIVFFMFSIFLNAVVLKLEEYYCFWINFQFQFYQIKIWIPVNEFSHLPVGISLIFVVNIW